MVKFYVGIFIDSNELQHACFDYGDNDRADDRDGTYLNLLIINSFFFNVGYTMIAKED